MTSNHLYDIFLSHATPDKPAVETIAKQLEAQGLRTFVDRWHLVPGKPIHEALQEALKGSASCAVFLGPAKMGPWQNEELYAALETQVRNEDFRVIPVLLPGTVIPERSEQPWFLSRRLWVDFRPGLEDQDAMHRLVCGIKGLPPGITQDAGDPSGNMICPYVGMETFTEENAGFFFGRGALTQYLVEKLRENRFLAVLGPSGSGKSSVVRAGLVPAVRRGELPGSGNWPIVTVKPGENPVENLAFGVAKHPAFKEHLGAVSLVKDIMADRMALHLNVRLALPEDDPDYRALIVVDQLEEVFTLCSDETLRRNFVNNLLYATEVAGGRTLVVATLRADFYHRAAVMPSLADYLSEHQVLVTPMVAEELEEAIEGPARKVGMTFEEGLVETLRGDVLGQPGGLPLLEYALLELWEQREGNRMTLKGYHSIGGVQGAIAARADAEFKKLDDRQQTAARRIMLRLVRPGEGTEDTRRRARMDEIGDADDPATRQVVETFTGARLLITGRDESSGAELLDVAHEALIRNWPRLRGWLDESREALRAQRRLSEQASEWQTNQQGNDWLLRGAALEEAGRLVAERGADLNPAERTFVDASQRLKAREVLRRKLSIGTLVVLLLISLATSITGWRFWQQAEEQRLAAEEQRQLAEAQRLLAEQREREANNERLRADAARLAAEEQRSLAEQRQQDAERQQNIAYARQLAAQARFYKERDPVLSLLLGVQATQAAGHSGLPYAPSTEESLRETLATPIGPVLQGHASSVVSVAISANNRWMASGDQGGAINLWRMGEDARLVSTLEGHQDQVQALTITPDNQWLFSGGLDGTLRRWSLQAQGPQESLLLHDLGNAIWAITVTPDNRWLVAGTTQGVIHFHPLESPHHDTFEFQGHEGSVNALVIDSQAEYLYSAGEDGLIHRWPLADILEGRYTPQSFQGHEGSVFSLTIAEEGQWLASGGRDGTVRLWSLQADRLGETPRVLRGHEGAINAVVASRDGQWLASAGRDGTIRIWWITDAVVATTILRSHLGSIWALATSSRNQWLVSASEDQTLRLWRVGEETSTPIVLREHQGFVWAVHASADGRWVASAGYDGIVRVWSTVGELGEPKRYDSGSRIWSLASDSQSRWLAAATEDGNIDIWQLDDPDAEPRVLSGHQGRIYSLVADPRDRWLVSGGMDTTVRIWALDRLDAPPVVLREHTDEVLAVDISPDGRWLATAGADTTIRLWQLEDPTQPPLTLEGHLGRVLAVDFSPDGQTLASGGEDGTVRLWRLDRPLGTHRVLRGHEGRVLDITFKTNGEWLSSSGSDGTVQIWPMGLAKPVPQVLRGHEGRVWTVDFSPDGQWLGSGGADGTVRLWETQLATVIQRACRFAGRNFTWEEWQRLIDRSVYHKTCTDLPVHESVYQPLMEAARAMAQSGNSEAVVRLLESALERAPELAMDPQEMANELLSSVAAEP